MTDKQLLLLDPRAIRVVTAYLKEFDNTPLEQRRQVIDRICGNLKSSEIARLTGMPVRKVYKYRRAGKLYNFDVRDWLTFLSLRV